MTNDFLDLINKSETIAVLNHINADGDALGSAYAMTKMLKNLGKKVDCIFETACEERLDFLGGEYSIYDGNLKKYDLCIAVDTATMKRLGRRLEIYQNAAHTICIDHHEANDYVADVKIVKPSYAAASELIYELFSDANLKLDDEIAMYLYAGIMSDTGCLKFSSTSPKTVRMVADLMEYKFDHSYITRCMFDSYSIEMIKLNGFVMNKIELYYNNKISFIETTDDDIKSFGITPENASNLVDIPRSVRGAEIAIELKERNGIVRASLRSNGEGNVHLVASRLGGGGHEKAAGITFESCTLAEAKKRLIDEATAELKRIGIM